MPSSERVRVRRRAGRGAYDRPSVHAILDEGLTGHLAFAQDGQPYAIPMLYVRVGEDLFLHGSPLSRAIGRGRDGTPVCFTVTLLDGIVLARSAFHHSLNYRSVVVLGKARPVSEEGAKRRAFDALVERVSPGRSREARSPSAGELEATEVLSLPLAEASAKVRTGPPVDAAEDMGLAVWAGEIPLRLVPGDPIPDAGCRVPLPASIGARDG